VIHNTTRRLLAMQSPFTKSTTPAAGDSRFGCTSALVYDAYDEELMLSWMDRDHSGGDSAANSPADRRHGAAAVLLSMEQCIEQQRQRFFKQSGGKSSGGDADGADYNLAISAAGQGLEDEQHHDHNAEKKRRHILQDRKWRAALSMCNEALKYTVMDRGDVAKRKFSKMQVLREAVEQMRFLENLLTNCHLLEMSPQSLAQIREEYLQAKNTGKLNQSILDNLAQRPANGQSAAHQHVSHHSKQLIAGLVEQREEEIEQKRLDLVVSAQKRSHSASVSLPAGQDYSQFTASSGSSQPSSGSSQTGGARKHHRHVPLEHYLHQTAADQHHHHLAAVNQESSQDDMLLNMLGGGAGGSEVACKTNDQQHDIDMMLHEVECIKRFEKLFNEDMQSNKENLPAAAAALVERSPMKDGRMKPRSTARYSLPPTRKTRALMDLDLSRVNSGGNVHHKSKKLAF